MLLGGKTLLRIGLAFAEQVLQSPYGAVLMLGLFLVVIGLQAHSRTCTSAGVMVLVLFMAQA
ncbi:hypothetical protein [Streptomyces regalis]|uniref:Uncharacterized protein n=1 Tax=Streptomyces regalis TaxID=68262 RepID=A0A0X3V731_9ACTN|nr:hypothetical protein [Streptomyces regalis]KUL40488.1 hypothetical protein ADL12_13100 [Streptomyces regalis]